MPLKEISPVELLEEMDRLIWWIDFGQYQGCKKIIVSKVKPITAKELVDAT